MAAVAVSVGSRGETRTSSGSEANSYTSITEQSEGEINRESALAETDDESDSEVAEEQDPQAANSSVDGPNTGYVSTYDPSYVDDAYSKIKALKAERSKLDDQRLTLVMEQWDCDRQIRQEESERDRYKRELENSISSDKELVESELYKRLNLEMDLNNAKMDHEAGRGSLAKVQEAQQKLDQLAEQVRNAKWNIQLQENIYLPKIRLSESQIEYYKNKYHDLEMQLINIRSDIDILTIKINALAEQLG